MINRGDAILYMIHRNNYAILLSKSSELVVNMHTNDCVIFSCGWTKDDLTILLQILQIIFPSLNMYKYYHFVFEIILLATKVISSHV